ncbi:helix-turn-helix domain-containing protein, partial [Candidatus Bipolaricaulota bacterium]|nr:helix-turn-helix domain-containing protein [Candidatus Bipolaricaulota bacterium]
MTLGILRTVFYRWKKRLRAYGADALHPRRTSARPGRPPLLGLVEERAIVATALAWPTWGPNRVSLQLARQGVHVSPSTVWRALPRMGLGRREARLLAVEGHAAKTAGLLTERTRRTLRRTRHVAV